MQCTNCGAEAPTQRVKMRQLIGMGYTLRSWWLEGDLCRNCTGRYFRSYSLTTLFLGWWGIVSFFLTPVVLLRNFAAYWSAFDLPRPSPQAANLPLDAPVPLVSAGPFALKLIYGIVVWSVLLGILAYASGGFMRRLAPSVYAMLRGRSAANAADVEHAFSQAGRDIAALEAPMRSSRWAEMRIALQVRKPSLQDFKAQNDTLQSLIPIERSRDVGPCERWIVDEAGPPLNTYEAAEGALLAMAENTPEVTPENSAALQALADQHDTAIQSLRWVYDNAAARGCGQ